MYFRALRAPSDGENGDGFKKCRSTSVSQGLRSNFFPRGRIEKLSAWVALNLGVLCGLAEVSRAVLNSVPVFLMSKVRWLLDQVSSYAYECE